MKISEYYLEGAHLGSQGCNKTGIACGVATGGTGNWSCNFEKVT